MIEQESSGLPENVFHLIPGMPDVITMSWLVMLLIVAVCSVAVFTVKKSPRGMQSAVEYFIEWLLEKAKDILGENAFRFMPLFVMLFLFIFFSNLLGLIPGLKSPTANISINLAMALIVFFSTHYFGIREKGFFGYFKHFCGPPYWLAPLFFPIHILSELIRPISLTLRLFFNILAKEVLLALLAALFVMFIALDAIPVIKGVLLTGDVFLRLFIMLLGVLVSFVQALVFTSLTMVYISGAVTPSEGH
jgi:F-type H+-transporting ATPase subunit a